MTQQEALNKLEDLKEHALNHMLHAGYEIKETVHVEIDKELPYLGYTTIREGKTYIVVALVAIEDESAINLLIHELSHIYCMQINHPSHNTSLVNQITGWAVHGQVIYPYQEKIIHNILNHLMDLYADDISFSVINTAKNQLDLNNFFLHWIHAPSDSKDPLEKAWGNADVLVSAAFAEASLKRHNIPDTDLKIEKARDALLNKMNNELKEKYEFYKTFMIYIPQEIEPKEYEKLLIKYLVEFLKLTKIA